MSEPGCLPCPPNTCADSPFDRVVVSYLIRGFTRLSWELLPTFTDPQPLLFQLQTGTTSNPDADDWTDVGLAVEDQYFAVDPEQRVWGKLNFTHYRLRLTTPLGVYYSLPVGAVGTLARRDWRIAREIVRQRRVLYRQAAQEGYLLKRRWTGEDCPVCLDFQTREIRNANCTTCFGTGKRCGYYFPMACVWASLSPKYRHTELDSGQARGTVDDIVVNGEMLGDSLLAENDVWIAKKTDDRYYVHEVQHTAEWRGVPLVANVKLRPVPFSSIVYSIDVPQQLAAVGA